jgi:WD40 repeat protein
MAGSRVLALWDCTTKDPPRELPCPAHAECYAIALSPDGKTLASADQYCIHLVDVATGKLLDFDGHHDTVKHVAFAADGRSLVSRCSRDALLTWEVPTGKLKSRSYGPMLMEKLGLVALSPDHLLGIAHGPPGELPVVLDLATGKKVATLHVKLNANLRVGHFSPWIRFFVVENPDRTMVLEPKTGERRCELPTLRGGHGLSFSSDEQTLAWLDDVGVIHLVDLAAGKELGTLGEPQQDWNRLQVAASLLFSPDGTRLAAYDPEREVVVLWDLGKRKAIREFRAEFYLRWDVCLAWSPDGRVLADNAGQGRSGIRLWETATGRLRREFATGANITSLAFSPDSCLLASGSNDTTVLIWDVLGTP